MRAKTEKEMTWEKCVPKEGQKWEKEEILSGNEPSEIEAMLGCERSIWNYSGR